MTRIEKKISRNVLETYAFGRHGIKSVKIIYLSVHEYYHDITIKYYHDIIIQYYHDITIQYYNCLDLIQDSRLTLRPGNTT